jgi:hypothetical protein
MNTNFSSLELADLQVIVESLHRRAPALLPKHTKWLSDEVIALIERAQTLASDDTVASQDLDLARYLCGVGGPVVGLYQLHHVVVLQGREAWRRAKN